MNPKLCGISLQNLGPETVLFLPWSSINILVLQGVLAKTKVAAANNKSLTHRSQAVGTECPSASRLRVESLLRPLFTTRDEQPLSMDCASWLGGWICSLLWVVRAPALPLLYCLSALALFVVMLWMIVQLSCIIHLMARHYCLPCQPTKLCFNDMAVSTAPSLQ